MDVPEGHPLGADSRAFLEDVRTQIIKKLKQKIRALRGVKFQLVLKVQLRKHNPDGMEEYTGPVFRHNQKAPLQTSEINEALDRVFHTIQETLEKWTQRGSGWFYQDGLSERQLLLPLLHLRQCHLQSGSW